MLDQSSTVIDLLPRLADPPGWLSGLISNFVSYGYDPATCIIRFGLTGAGIAPNYIIQEPSEPCILQIKSVRIQLTACPHRAFSGRTYREMVELDDLEWRDAHWSMNAFSFAEAKALLARLSESQTLH
jgi:hypothetical protein